MVYIRYEYLASLENDLDRDPVFVNIHLIIGFDRVRVRVGVKILSLGSGLSRKRERDRQRERERKRERK
jgi:hypothetical protein